MTDIDPSQTRNIVSALDETEVHIDGDGEQTIVMVHGWPDTYRLWDEQVEAFRDQYRCVRFTLPGFDIDRPRQAYSLDQIVGTLRALIDQVSPDKPVILMVHDWGCLFGYHYASQYPARVEKLIGLDIGDAGSRDHVRSLDGKAKAMVFAYQVWLAIAWRIGGSPGDWMTRWMAGLLHAPGDPASISSKMNYPYYIQWTGAHGSYRAARPFTPSMPMLFVYGSKKPFLFHSKAWADRLADKPGSRIVKLRTGHWMMSSRAEQFNDAVLGWLSGRTDDEASSAGVTAKAQAESEPANAPPTPPDGEADAGAARPAS